MLDPSTVEPAVLWVLDRGVTVVACRNSLDSRDARGGADDGATGNGRQRANWWAIPPFRALETVWGRVARPR
ncbi:hypothetical protein ACFQGE_15675 [Halomicroarcula sp. GCM10025817]|uniref:hypothetical protein n=1 Tax=Haloarcula TaxID=2237 RepID=UPI0023E89DE3|nr:hypothetical protein [Halomicroarcula sp. SYNS111]